MGVTSAHLGAGFAMGGAMGARKILSWKLPLSGARLRRDERGVVAIVVALSMTVLIGLVGLGIEVAGWYVAKRKLQAAADSAAIAAASENAKGNSAAVTGAAYIEAQRQGYQGATCSYMAQTSDCTVYSPPTSGGYTGDDTAFEVVLTESLSLAFTSVFTDQPPVIGARAVAHAETTETPGTACVLGLDTDDNNSVFLDNNAGIRCGVASNSDSASSLRLDNNAFVENGYTVVGAISLGNNATVDGSPQKAGADPVADPYADVAMPALPSCTDQDGAGKNNVTRNFTAPGGYVRFCDGWSFENNAVLNLAAGVYIIESQLHLKNNVTVNATGGVTIIVKGDYAIDLKNNAVLNITAPTSGDYAGVAIMGDRDGTSSVTQLFDNNAVLHVTGAVYFPNQIVMLENNATTGYCTQLIGRNVRLSNNAVVDNDEPCDGTGVRPISVGTEEIRIRLVE